MAAVPALALVTALSLGAWGTLQAQAQAQAPQKRTRILDACVYDLYFEQRSSQGVLARCQCAVRNASDQISDQEAASYKLGSRVTGSLRTKIYQALASCR